MHSLRLLLDLVPELLVEQRALPGARGIAAGDTLGQGFARRSHRRAARRSRRSVQALSLPHHHELRKSLPEEPQSLRGDCRTQAEAGRAADLGIGHRHPEEPRIAWRLEGWVTSQAVILRGSPDGRRTVRLAPPAITAKPLRRDDGSTWNPKEPFDFLRVIAGWQNPLRNPKLPRRKHRSRRRSPKTAITSSRPRPRWSNPIRTCLRKTSSRPARTIC